MLLAEATSFGSIQSLQDGTLDLTQQICSLTHPADFEVHVTVPQHYVKQNGLPKQPRAWSGSGLTKSERQTHAQVAQVGARHGGVSGAAPRSQRDLQLDVVALPVSLLQLTAVALILVLHCEVFQSAAMSLDAGSPGSCATQHHHSCEFLRYRTAHLQVWQGWRILLRGWTPVQDKVTSTVPSQAGWDHPRYDARHAHSR